MGTYFVPLIGVFLLVIALAAPGASPKPTRPVSRMSQPEPATRIMEPSPVPEMLIPTAAPPAPAQPSGYEQRSAAGNPAMFPTAMFPSFSQMQPAPLPAPEVGKMEKKQEPRDEIVDLVAVLAILKLISS